MGNSLIKAATVNNNYNYVYSKRARNVQHENCSKYYNIVRTTKKIHTVKPRPPGWKEKEAQMKSKHWNCDLLRFFYFSHTLFNIIIPQNLQITWNISRKPSPTLPSTTCWQNASSDWFIQLISQIHQGIKQPHMKYKFKCVICISWSLFFTIYISCIL